MGVPTSEVGYTSATARSGDHESSYEHVVALEKKLWVLRLKYGGFFFSLGAVAP